MMKNYMIQCIIGCIFLVIILVLKFCKKIKDYKWIDFLILVSICISGPLFLNSIIGVSYIYHVPIISLLEDKDAELMLATYIPTVCIAYFQYKIQSNIISSDNKLQNELIKLNKIYEINRHFDFEGEVINFQLCNFYNYVCSYKEDEDIFCIKLKSKNNSILPNWFEAKNVKVFLEISNVTLECRNYRLFKNEWLIFGNKKIFKNEIKKYLIMPVSSCQNRNQEFLQFMIIVEGTDVISDSQYKMPIKIKAYINSGYDIDGSFKIIFK